MNKIAMVAVSLLLVTLAFVSCKDRSEKQEAEAVQNQVDSIMEQSKIEAGVSVWEIDYEKKTMTRNRLIDTADLSVDSIILGLNKRYPAIRLEKVGQTRDTLVTRISDASQLTERMGSTGAEMYVTEAIMNLTSAPGIQFLRIDFKAGTHASPGKWSARDITELKRVE